MKCNSPGRQSQHQEHTFVSLINCRESVELVLSDWEHQQEDCLECFYFVNLSLANALVFCPVKH